MKRITLLLLTALATMIPLCSQAQGNLQFNQARKIQFTLDTPLNTNNNTYSYMMGPYVVSVPVGKVLKIESMNVSQVRENPGFPAMNVFGYSGGYAPAMLFLEETLVYANPSYNSGVGGSLPHSIIWLPAGDHNFYIGAEGCSGSASSPCGRSYSAMITAIEFNVVP